MAKQCALGQEEPEIAYDGLENRICAPDSGVYSGFHAEELVSFCERHDLIIHFLLPPGTFVLSGTDLMACNKVLNVMLKDELMKFVRIREMETIEDNYVYGLQQLTEIANRALSPGINDQGTAVVALRSLFTLLAGRINTFPQKDLYDSRMNLRLIVKMLDFEEIVKRCVFPVWNYGKNDPAIQFELNLLIRQINHIQQSAVMSNLLAEVTQQLND